MKKIRQNWWKVLLPAAAILLLSGCLFRSPDDLYRLPEVPADYDVLKTAIRTVQADLEMEYGTSSEVAVILSGDNTANIQLQDLDGDGQRAQCTAEGSRSLAVRGRFLRTLPPSLSPA